MLNFEKLTIDNLKKWKNLIYGLDCNSESSIVNMYLWEHYYESLFCIDDGILYGIYANKKTGNKEAFMPYGKNRCSEKVIDKLISFLKNDTPQSIPVINFATEDFLTYILNSGRYNISYCELPNSFDYVYNVRDLIDLKGKKYHSKKNHYNSFVKKYDFNYVRYEKSLYEKCMEFCDNVIDEQIHSSQEAKKYELQSIKKALDNYDDLEIICSLLTIDDKIIALSVGEVLNDDYALIHIEKASYEHRTAYSVINRLMLQNEFGHMKFVNREEDLGIEGLRKAKESYHPCKYIKKYRIQFYKGVFIMVYIMLADGFEEIEALAVVDILRRGDVKISTVSVYNKQTVIGAHSINVIPDIKFDDISYDDCECIILPGGMPGTINLQENSKLETLLKNAFSDKKYIGAICAAPMILGQLGFLKNKEATCYPSFEEYLLDAKVSNKRVCVSENIITSRGAGTAHDFAFSLLETLKGKDTSDKIRESMLYDC